MKKVSSSHCADLDFDKGYLNKVIIVEGHDFVSEVKSKKPGLVNAKSKRGGTRRKRQYQTRLSYEIEIKNKRIKYSLADF